MLHDGKIRRGLMGLIDLEQYDFQKGAQSAIRATEGTVLSRIPPRVRIREHATLELPHVMLLFDDPNAVSYTHLDVYKRQEGERMIDMMSFLSAVAAIKIQMEW